MVYPFDCLVDEGVRCHGCRDQAAGQCAAVAWREQGGGEGHVEVESLVVDGLQGCIG
jgi:hypothetical protein